MNLPDLPIGSPLDPQTVALTDASLSEGEVLAGKYRVDRILGAGGMGVVVAATHVLLDQPVALKFMLRATQGDPDLAERFLREARAMARLRSEHVVRILDLGLFADSAPYMVMELLEGRDLRSILVDTGPMRVSDAVRYIAQACEAVAEAHARGIVHRDLKPHNLFVTNKPNGEEHIKVLDFGISKVNTDPALTRPTTLLGSPHYMAPEQIATPRAVDGRADIWALGVCLYQLLTKRTPFEAPGLLAFSEKLLSEPPFPIERHRPDLPVALVRVIDQCLEKSPERRFATANELGEALEAALGGSASARHPSMPPVPPTTVAPSGSTIAPVAIRNGARVGSFPSVPPPSASPSKRVGSTRARMTAVAAALFVAGVTVGVLGRPSAGPQDPPQAAVDLPDVPPPPELPSARLTPEPRPPATGVPGDDAGPPSSPEGRLRRPKARHTSTSERSPR
jgi:serine/threonine-protein kinase